MAANKKSNKASKQRLRFTNEWDPDILDAFTTHQTALKWYLKSRYDLDARAGLDAEFLALRMPLVMQAGEYQGDVVVQNGKDGRGCGWCVVLLMSDAGGGNVRVAEQWEARESRLEAYEDMFERVEEGYWGRAMG